MKLDWTIIYWIKNNISCDFLDFVMPKITSLGNAGLLWIFISLILLVIPKTRRIGIGLAFSLICCALISNVILKPLVARIRPYNIDKTLILLIKEPWDFSFPSGHAAASITFVAFLVFIKNKFWILPGILAILICFSRIYLFVHYPSDVFAGFIIGILCGFFGKLLYNSKVFNKFSFALPGVAERPQRSEDL